jgi:RNA polymerase sigma-70 factor (ECF subfamily)
VDEWTRLALSARSGDESARLAFVRATQDEVWRLCAYLGDRDAADDLTQETYLRVFRALRRFRGEAPVRSWLFSIVRRVVADDIAARQRRRATTSEQAGQQATQHPDPASELALVALVGELDQERRTAFVLTQLIGYSYAEAADVCGCPVGTIRSRVARARADLVAMLDQGSDGISRSHGSASA